MAYMGRYDNLFSRERKKLRAPQSNIGLYSRQQKNRATNPNRTSSSAYGRSRANRNYSQAGASRIYNPQTSNQKTTRRVGPPQSLRYRNSPAAQALRPRPNVPRIGGSNYGQSRLIRGLTRNSRPKASYARPGQKSQRQTPQTPQMPQMPQAPQYDPAAQLSAFYNQSMQNRLSGIDDQAKLDQDTINQTFDLQNEAMSSQIPQLQEGYDLFRNDVLAGIDDEKAATERDIEKAEEQAGSAQRDLMQARRQMMGQRARQYGALGTIDSYGTGSFTQANANDDTAFLRMTNENMQRKADRVAELERGLRRFTRQAQNQINTENIKLKQAISQIQNNVALNEAQKQAALRQVVLSANQNKQQIKDEFQSYQMQLQQERAEMQNAVSEYSNLSQEFLATGKPTTPADIEFFQKNKDGMSAYQEAMGLGGQNQDAILANQTINELLGSNLGAVSGWGGVNPINRMPGSEHNYTRAQMQKLLGLLSLEAREKLKGQGTITDSEMKTLERSIGALGLDEQTGASNLNEQDLRRELGTIQSVLNRANQRAGRGNAGIMQEIYQNDPLGLGL